MDTCTRLVTRVVCQRLQVLMVSDRAEMTTVAIATTVSSIRRSVGNCNQDGHVGGSG